MKFLVPARKTVVKQITHSNFGTSKPTIARQYGVQIILGTISLQNCFCHSSNEYYNRFINIVTCNHIPM